MTAMILYLDEKRLTAMLTRILESPHSTFYKERLTGISAASELEDIPFLTRAAFSEVDPAERLYVPPEEVEFVGYTSGTTTGEPLINYFAAVDDYYFDPSLGLDVSRLLITYPPLNKNFGASFIQQCRQAPTPVTPIFADFQNLANSAVIAKRTKPDALYATPTIALQLADYLEEHYNLAAFKLVAVSSELLTDAKRAALQLRFPNAKIANLYASSEIGQFLLYPCVDIMDEGVSRFHFLEKAVVALELIDNELVITCDQNKAFPLIRYKTGDQFTVLDEVCSCGNPYPVLELLGRDGVDSVRVHGFEIRAGAVDAFFASLPAVFTSYQLHFREGEEVGSFSLTIEVAAPKGSEEVNTSLVRDAFLHTFNFAAKKNTASLIESGILDSLTVTAVTSHSHEGVKHKVLVSHL